VRREHDPRGIGAQLRSCAPPAVASVPIRRALSGTPQTAKNCPRLKADSVGDSTCRIPLVSCVCSGEKKCPGSIPMSAGTVTWRPLT